MADSVQSTPPADPYVGTAIAAHDIPSDLVPIREGQGLKPQLRPAPTHLGAAPGWDGFHDAWLRTREFRILGHYLAARSDMLREDRLLPAVGGFLPRGDRPADPADIEWPGVGEVWAGTPLADLLASWRKGFLHMEAPRDKHGDPLASFENVKLYLEWLGYDNLWFNAFTHKTMVGDAPLDDNITKLIKHRLECECRLRVSKERLDGMICEMAARNPYHPVQAYLKSLKWDGKPRTDGWLIKYAHAEDTELNRDIGKKMLVQLVARCFFPGIKADHMAVLIGPQGCGKSTLCRILACKDEWFRDHFPFEAPDGQKVLEQTNGAWLVEVSELAGMTNRDREHVKAVLSRQDDTARLAYARQPTTVPRSFVLIGTSNDAQFLADDTGNRRFWPVMVCQPEPGEASPEGNVVQMRRKEFHELLKEKPDGSARPILVKDNEAGGDDPDLDDVLVQQAEAPPQPRQIDMEGLRHDRDQLLAETVHHLRAYLDAGAPGDIHKETVIRPELRAALSAQHERTRRVSYAEEWALATFGAESDPERKEGRINVLKVCREFGFTGQSNTAQFHDLRRAMIAIGFKQGRTKRDRFLWRGHRNHDVAMPVKDSNFGRGNSHRSA